MKKILITGGTVFVSRYAATEQNIPGDNTTGRRIERVRRVVCGK